MTKVEIALKKKGGPLLGTCLHTYHTGFVEIAGRVGFDILWIDCEHLAIPETQVGDLCRIAAGAGMLSLVRPPDANRTSVLRAAESGPDIIFVPMVNSADTARQLVTHARFAPVGSRGFFLGTRAMGYGLVDAAERQRQINDELCLLAQVETMEAVERVDEIADVPGLNGVFIGPGDLAASMGYVGRFQNPAVKKTIAQVVAAVKRKGLLVALPVSPDEAGEWADQGVDLIFCGNETQLLRAGLLSCFNGAQGALKATPGARRAGSKREQAAPAARVVRAAV